MVNEGGQGKKFDMEMWEFLQNKQEGKVREIKEQLEGLMESVREVMSESEKMKGENERLCQGKGGF